MPHLIIDIEASGLGPGSFPIEIGWFGFGCAVWRISADRPEADWPLSAWDEVAEDSHAIWLAMLRREGMLAADLCRALRGAFNGLMLVSAADLSDQAWLDRLLEAE